MPVWGTQVSRISFPSMAPNDLASEGVPFIVAVGWFNQELPGLVTCQRRAALVVFEGSAMQTHADWHFAAERKP